THVLSREGAGAPGRVETRERWVVVDDREVRRQMYWVGILNTEPTFIPRVDWFELTKDNLEQLDPRPTVPDIAILRERLVGHSLLTQADFEVALDGALPNAPYPERFSILYHAKNVRSMVFDHALLFQKLLYALLACAVVLLVALRRVDLNLYSLHDLYYN